MSELVHIRTREDVNITMCGHRVEALVPLKHYVYETVFRSVSERLETQYKLTICEECKELLALKVLASV